MPNETQTISITFPTSDLPSATTQETRQAALSVLGDALARFHGQAIESWAEALHVARYVDGESERNTARIAAENRGALVRLIENISTGVEGAMEASRSLTVA